MWKTVLILMLTALAIFFARRALKVPAAETGIGAAIELLTPAPAQLTPPLMYAGVRG
jgi:hypothetical protein